MDVENVKNSFKEAQEIITLMSTQYDYSNQIMQS
jgi:hypothetical protein